MFYDFIGPIGLLNTCRLSMSKTMKNKKMCDSVVVVFLPDSGDTWSRVNYYSRPPAVLQI